MLSRASQIQRLWKTSYQSDLVKTAIYVVFPESALDDPNYRKRMRHYQTAGPLRTEPYTVQAGDTLDSISESVKGVDENKIAKSYVEQIIKKSNETIDLTPGSIIAMPKYEDMLWNSNLGSFVYILKLKEREADKPVYYVGETENIFRRLNQHRLRFPTRGDVYIDYAQELEDAAFDDYFHSGTKVISRRNLESITLEYVEILEDKSENAYVNYRERLKREKHLFFELLAIYGPNRVRGSYWTQEEDDAEGRFFRKKTYRREYINILIDVANNVLNSNFGPEDAVEARKELMKWRQENPNVELYDERFERNKSETLLQVAQSSFPSGRDVAAERSYQESVGRRRRVGPQRGSVVDAAPRAEVKRALSELTTGLIYNNNIEKWRNFLSEAVLFVSTTARNSHGFDPTLVTEDTTFEIIKKRSVNQIVESLRWHNTRRLETISREKTESARLRGHGLFNEFKNDIKNKYGFDILSIEDVKRYLTPISQEGYEEAFDEEIFDKRIEELFFYTRPEMLERIKERKGKGTYNSRRRNLARSREAGGRWSEDSKVEISGFYNAQNIHSNLIHKLKKLIILTVISEDATCGTDLLERIKSIENINELQLEELDVIIFQAVSCINKDSIFDGINADNLSLLEQTALDVINELYGRDPQAFISKFYLPRTIEKFREKFSLELRRNKNTIPLYNLSKKELTLEQLEADSRRLNEVEQYIKSEKHLTNAELTNHLRFFNHWVSVDFVVVLGENGEEEVKGLKDRLGIDQDLLSFVDVLFRVNKRKRLEILEEHGYTEEHHQMFQNYKDLKSSDDVPMADIVGSMVPDEESERIIENSIDNDRLMWDANWPKTPDDTKIKVISLISRISYRPGMKQKTLRQLHQDLIENRQFHREFSALLDDDEIKTMARAWWPQMTTNTLNFTLKKNRNDILNTFNYMPPEFLETFRFKAFKLKKKKLREKHVRMFWQELRKPDLTLDMFQASLTSRGITAHPRILKVIFDNKNIMDYETFKELFIITKSRSRKVSEYDINPRIATAMKQTFITEFNPNNIDGEIEKFKEKFKDAQLSTSLYKLHKDFYKEVFCTLPGNDCVVIDGKKQSNELEAWFTWGRYRYIKSFREEEYFKYATNVDTVINYMNEFIEMPYLYKIFNLKFNERSENKISFYDKMKDWKQNIMRGGKKGAKKGAKGGLLGRVAKVLRLTLNDPTVTRHDLIVHTDLYGVTGLTQDPEAGLDKALEAIGFLTLSEIDSLVESKDMGRGAEAQALANNLLPVPAPDSPEPLQSDLLPELQEPDVDSPPDEGLDLDEDVIASFSRWLTLRKFAQQVMEY